MKSNLVDSGKLWAVKYLLARCLPGRSCQLCCWYRHQLAMHGLTWLAALCGNDMLRSRADE